MPSRIGDALHWYASYRPNKIAIVSSEGAQTYAQLWSRVCRLGSGLAELGLVPGDRIALLMQNSSRYLEIYQAAALMGMAVVPLNFRFTAPEGDELPARGFAKGEEGFEAPAASGAAVEVVIPPGSERLQLLAPFPRWDGKDFTEMEITYTRVQ